MKEVDAVGGAEPRVRNFLIALFEETAKTIAKFGENENMTTRIRKFREFMSKDQHMESAGSERIYFYGCVVKRAESVC